MKRSVTAIVVGTLLSMAGGTVQATGPGTAPHWGYEGEEGPGHWGELAPEFATCGSGESQSPIDISTVEQAGMVAIGFDYGSAPLEVINNGRTVQVNYAEGSSIQLVGKEYRLLQFHFHTPSEHLVDGEHYPAEIHLVHRSEDGTLAVVGLLVEQGHYNPALVKLIAHMPLHVGERSAPEGVVIDVARLLPEDRRYYRYMGSLTTPPCSEGVNWVVMREPIQLSADQIEALEGVMGENARPVQPRHGRPLLGASVVN